MHRTGTAPARPSHRRHLAVATAALLALSLLSACSSEEHPRAATTPTASSPSTLTPSATDSADGWRGVTDDNTGISFELPDTPTTQTRDTQTADGTPVTAIAYLAEVDAEDVDDTISVTATVLFSPSGPADFPPAPLAMRAMVRNLRAAGATDARLSSVVRSRAGSSPAYDGTITFTAAGGDKRTYWRMRTAVGPDWMVQLQAQIFTENITDDVRAQVDDLLERLAASLTVPS